MAFCPDTARLIAEYLPKHRLRPWIKLRKLDNSSLCGNESAGIVDLLREHPNRIRWNVLSSNPAAIDLLLENLDSIDWKGFSSNVSPKAIEILESKLDKVKWYYLSANPAAIRLIEANLEKANIERLFYNPAADGILEILGFKNIRNYNRVIANPELVNRLSDAGWKILSGNPLAENIIRANLHRVNWHSLSENPAEWAVKMLAEEYPNRIDWYRMSANRSDAAMRLVEANLRKADWRMLSGNPYAIQLLEKYPGNVNYLYLSRNPMIFEEVSEMVVSELLKV